MTCSYQETSTDESVSATLAQRHNDESTQPRNASSLAPQRVSASRPPNDRQATPPPSLDLDSSALLPDHGSASTDTLYLDAWRDTQATFSSGIGPASSASPLALDWLLQADDAPIDWTAYLGDSGMQLRSHIFDLGDLSTSRFDHDGRPAAYALQQRIDRTSSSLMGVTVATCSRTPDSHHRTTLAASRSNPPAQASSQPAAYSAASRAPVVGVSPVATSDAAAEAAATLARIRSAAVHRGYLHSATPSEDGNTSSQSSGDEKQPSDAHAAWHASGSSRRRSRKSRHRRGRTGSNPETQAVLSQDPSLRFQDSLSGSSDLDPVERADRDIAVQPRQQRVSYRQPAQSAHRHLNPDPAAPSPEDLARQEALLEQMVQSGQEIHLAQGRSPNPSSERSNERRKRRHECWPSVYRPKATDGGRHLSLDRVPFASAEVIALENSYQVVPMTDLAKERMIDEFRFCEVEAWDLERIQNTLRSIQTSTLNLFLQLYFEHHDPVLPILHRASFDPDACDPLLLAAVTCLGALCSEAENAFAYSLLTSSLVHAVSYKLIGINHLRGRYLPSMQTLLLTYALWRNLGDPAKLEYVEGFRNTVLTMARRCRLFEMEPFTCDPNVGTGGVPADAHVAAAKQEEKWSRWIRHQEMVRTSWALFVLDSDLSLAWDLPCTITIGELRSPLPCSESLWQAESAEEWSSLRGQQAADTGNHFLSRFLNMNAGESAKDTRPAPPSGAEGTRCQQAQVQHTSPLTHLVLSSAVHNVALNRWNMETVLTQQFDSHGNEESNVADRAPTVPRKDPEFEKWVESAGKRLHILSSSQPELSSKCDAQLMLYGARLRMLVSFNAIQIMSGRKGYRRSKVQAELWFQGPLRQEQYRDDIFKVASKIFTMSLATRGDVGTNSGRTNVSGTGAENSILFYATVCLALLSQYLVQSQVASDNDQATTTTLSNGGHTSASATDADYAPKPLKRMRKKDVYFLAGVGALTNPVSLDRLVHIAVHQGLNHSSWPLGQVLGKVLQQWTRTLTR
ncbi:uncharacterized protein UTRI_03002 [Ustilago trichophora]|uniref:Xylanolytic transcriptional activator regulatory domain-containing protein n=1 Tax=Ustilago trichophora TaxID=86804 RepID=A0A5C3E7P6_9BASI|nr:uncharacterized protein UTRI_03002 [Ustilago trichophora]